MDPTGGYEDLPFVAEFYDHVAPYRDRGDVAFYVAMARRHGGPVLEVGCGTGRVLIRLARAGIPSVGLDLSQRMLEVCRSKLAREPRDVRDRVELVRADMRDFDLARRFPLVIVPFRPFQHLLEVEDQLACLRALRRHLVPAGRLILDLFNPSLPLLVDASLEKEHGDEPDAVLPDGRGIRRRERIAARDLFRQISHVELIYYVFHPDGREERLVHAFPMRYIFRYEAEHLLAREGFEVQEVLGDFDGNPYGTSYPGELIFIARPAGDPAPAPR